MTENQFEDAVKQKVKNLEERISKLENQVKPSIKAVETDSGKHLVIRPAGTDKWVNKKYLNRVLEDIDMEISEIEDLETDSEGNYSSGDDLWG